MARDKSRRSWARGGRALRAAEPCRRPTSRTVVPPKPSPSGRRKAGGSPVSLYSFASFAAHREQTLRHPSHRVENNITNVYPSAPARGSAVRCQLLLRRNGAGQAREPREKHLELRLARRIEVIEIGAAIDDLPEVLGLDAIELLP